MSGISSKALAFGYPRNKEKFVRQELDDDLGLNWYQFKFRNHDPQIGRFIEVDPLADNYVHNSTYAYAENRVINGIDLEGLEFFPVIFNWIVNKFARHNSDANNSLTALGNISTDQAGHKYDNTPIAAPLKDIANKADKVNNYVALAQPHINNLAVVETIGSLAVGGEAGAAEAGIYTVVSNGTKSTLLSATEGNVTKALGTRFVTEVEATSFGKVVARGTVDLEPTFTRIEAGNVGKAFGRNDGIVFQNKEGLLPTKDGVAYREYVVPTEGVKGAGPMRIVQGSDGSAYYTSDHYKSFVQVR